MWACPTTSHIRNDPAFANNYGRGSALTNATANTDTSDSA